MLLTSLLAMKPAIRPKMIQVMMYTAALREVFADNTRSSGRFRSLAEQLDALAGDTQRDPSRLEGERVLAEHLPAPA